MNKLESQHGKEGTDFRRTIIQYKLNNQDMRFTQSNKQYPNNLTVLINACLEDDPLKLDFEELCYLYKKLAQRLAYLVTFLKYITPHYQQKLSDLNSLTRTVEILVRSTQYQKYGHTLPLFQFVGNKLQNMNISNFISLDQQALINRIFLNQASSLYFNIKQSPISKNLLYSQNFQSFFRSLNNPQCIGCSPVFLKHCQIINRNPLFRNILFISYKENLTHFNLASHICSLLNSGGGCILIGTQKKQHQIYTKGFCFRQDEEIMQKQAMAAHAVSSVRPKFYYLFQTVLINSDPFQDTFHEFRFCFRIIIFPILKQCVGFVEVQEGNELRHKFFRLNKQNNSEQIVGETNGISQQFYLFAHANYKKSSRPQRNSHKNIMCFCSYHQKSGIKNEISSLPCNINQQMDSEQADVKSKVDQIRFPYERTSLLVLPSSKFNKEVKVFQKELKKRGYLVELFYPFPSYIGSPTTNKRPVWMLSHQIHGDDLKKILKGMQGQEIVGTKTIKIMPVHKTLQLEKQKLPEQKFKKFRKKFYDKFHHPFHQDLQKASVKKGKVQEIFHFTFQDYNEAIFAYILCEDLQIRPYFVKEGGIYKLKET